MTPSMQIWSVNYSAVSSGALKGSAIINNTQAMRIIASRSPINPTPITYAFMTVLRAHQESFQCCPNFGDMHMPTLSGESMVQMLSAVPWTIS